MGVFFGRKWLAFPGLALSDMITVHVSFAQVYGCPGTHVQFARIRHSVCQLEIKFHTPQYALFSFVLSDSSTATIRYGANFRPIANTCTVIEQLNHVRTITLVQSAIHAKRQWYLALPVRLCTKTEPVPSQLYLCYHEWVVRYERFAKTKTAIRL